jgi:hypothetical protein
MITVRIQDAEQIEQRLNVLAERLRLSWDFEVECEVHCRVYQDRRSRAQNRLYWEHLSILARELSTDMQRLSKDDMHDMLRNRFLGMETVRIAGDTVTRLPSTTKLQRGEMYHYMEQVIAWASSVAIDLPIPADNEFMNYRRQQDDV